MNDIKKEAVARIINRHMARLLTGLNEINAPVIIVQAVKSAFLWMQKDIGEEMEHE
jgi:hypothetical protein